MYLVAFAWLLASHVNACILAVSSFVLGWPGPTAPSHSLKQSVIRQITFINVCVNPEAGHCLSVRLCVRLCAGCGRDCGACIFVFLALSLSLSRVLYRHIHVCALAGRSLVNYFQFTAITAKAADQDRCLRFPFV